MTLSLLYLILIVLANVFAALWQIPLPLGLMVPAGVFFFAPLFTLRDRIQVDRGVRWIYLLIAVSSVVSWIAGSFMGAPLLARVAIASVVAFVVSETLDTIIFTVLKRSFTERALTSNFFSAFVDSVIFIGVAFGVNWRLIIGQWVVKMLISAVTIPLVIPRKHGRNPTAEPSR